MKKLIYCFSFTLGFLILINWGAKQKSIVSGNNLHRINFFGKIVPFANQDKETKIDNISIENLIKQIPMYEAPTSKTENIDPKTHTITANPKDILPQKFFDLKEAGQIETKREAENPVVWKYMELENNSVGASALKEKRDYIELIITPPQNPQSPSPKKKNYIIESKQLLRYNEVSSAGPIESKLNFKGLLKLTIGGYTDRELDKKETSKIYKD